MTTLQPQVSATATAAATTAAAPAPATSESATPTPLPPPAATSAPASPSPTPTPTPSASASPTGSASPPNLDPCQLVTQSEASTLAGATFGPGREESTGGGKECVYGYQTLNVMDVIVAEAPDAKTARFVYAQELGEAQAKIASDLPAGVSVKLDTTNTAGIGDEASTITGSGSIQGQTISFTGIYVISGATFFTIGDLVLAKAPPTVTAIQDQAKVTLGRL
ncbi:MAG TPA: hypothetical protein VFG00_06075 [Acidothermaceae bacterium]|nr:hypothetical protein [Acidothermaceae bacterium]